MPFPKNWNSDQIISKNDKSKIIWCQSNIQQEKNERVSIAPNRKRDEN